MLESKLPSRSFNFDKKVIEALDGIALIYQEETLTFRELNERATQLAQHLISHGISKNAPIGISVKGSIDLEISLLAILKAGGSYVPIDPAIPTYNLQLMISDSNLKIILSTSDFENKIAKAKAQIILVDQFDFKSFHQNPSQVLGVPDAFHLKNASLNLNIKSENYREKVHIRFLKDGNGRIPIKRIDLSGTADPNDSKLLLVNVIKQELKMALAPATGPLIRINLIKFFDKTHILLWVAQHIIYSGWSNEIILDELRTLYDA